MTKKISNPPVNDNSEVLFERMVELLVWSHVDLHYLKLAADGKVDPEPGRPAVIVARFKETASILISIVSHIENSTNYQIDLIDAPSAKSNLKGDAA